MALTCVLAGVAGCGGDDDSGREREAQRKREESRAARGISEEYRAAQAVKGFLVAYTEGDGPAACRRLTPQRQDALIREQKAPSCQRAVRLQSGTVRGADLERLYRSKVSKVAITGREATAEVLTPAAGGGLPEAHTVQLRRVGDAWLLATNFFLGGLQGGKVPKPPPPPPRDPAQERRIESVFRRFRDALARGDGHAACALRTAGARKRAVAQSVQAAGSEKEARREFGKLDCASVSAGLRIPDQKVKDVRVDGARGTLTLTGGATYRFRKVAGSWRLES